MSKNSNHYGPHCAGLCEGAAYQGEQRRLRAKVAELEAKLKMYEMLPVSEAADKLGDEMAADALRGATTRSIKDKRIAEQDAKIKRLCDDDFPEGVTYRDDEGFLERAPDGCHRNIAVLIEKINEIVARLNALGEDGSINYEPKPYVQRVKNVD